MPLSKLPFAPGFHTEGTDYSVGPTWVDGDKVRFRKGLPEQIGGWETYPIAVQFPVDAAGGETTSTFRGVCRSLYDWGTAASSKYLGIGTNLKFYIEIGGQVYDITPLRVTTAAGDITFAATSGSSTIVVSDNDHGAVQGDYVKFQDSASLGGTITAAVLNHEYEIDSLIDTDSYNITAREADQTEVTANASDTGNGGVLAYAQYQINTGTNSYLASTGYGVGTYGGVATGAVPATTWGGGGAIGFSSQLRLYSQDAFADDLIFCPRGGGIFYWDESSGTSARAIDIADTTEFPYSSNAPIKALQVMVSPVDRHVIAFGVNALGDDTPATSTIDPLLIRWSDQESAIDWTPTATNSAGGKVLSSGTRIVGAVRTRQEILVFTDTSIHAMRFSGAPYVFQFSPIGENVSIVSPKAAIPAGDAVYFMDMEGFYIYQGSVRPLSCDVLNDVFSEINMNQLYKVYAMNNPDKSEVTWFYPIGEETTDITNYVTYNYLDGLWTTGTFDRGAWINVQTRSYPYAASNDTENVKENILYRQETGYSADGDDIAGWIESGMAELGDGEYLMYIDRLIPDFRFNGSAPNAQLDITINGYKFPMGEITQIKLKTIGYNSGQVNPRMRARAVSLKVEGSGIGYGWTMGQFRLDMRTDGRR